MQTADQHQANLGRNLESLRSVDPDLADRIQTCPLPNDLQPAETFDGCDSFRADSLSDSGWFAHTSMPAVREEALVDQFEHGGSNVLLPGSGHGYAIRELLERLGRHNTVYVWETRTIHLALLLRLYDFAADLATRRLALMLGDDLEKTLGDFFVNHPRMTPPAKMISWPWLSPNQVHQYFQHVEAAVARIGQVRSDLLKNARAKVEAMTAEPTQPLRVFVCSMAARPAMHQVALDLAWGFDRLGYRCQTLLMDQPEHGSALALADAIADFRPHRCASVGLARHDLTVRPPDAMPFASILGLPGMKLSPALVEHLHPGPRETFFAFGDNLDELRDKFPSVQIEPLQPAVNEDTFRPLNENEIEPHRRADVLVFADVDSLDPAAFGVTQESHKTLCRHLQAAVEASPLAYRESEAENLLTRVSRHAGIELDDQDLFRAFADLLIRQIGPTASAVAVVRHLTRANLNVAILGSGWNKYPEFAPLARQAPDDPADVNRTINAAALVLCLEHRTNWRPHVLNALCAARPVALKRLPNDKLTAVEALRGATVELHQQDPAQTIRKALREANTLQPKSLAARNYLANHHSYRQLAQTILDRTA